MTVLVTGATGFVGRHLVAALRAGGVEVRAAVRPSRRQAGGAQAGGAQVGGAQLSGAQPGGDQPGRAQLEVPPGSEPVEGRLVRALPPDVQAVPWEAPARPDPAIFEGVDALVHLAAHLPARYGDPAEASRCLSINALGTLELLLGAVDAGVGRAVCLSTGNLYASPDAATEAAATYPSRRAPYYLASKLCGEIWASHLDQADRIEVVVLRPSAIYGPGMAGGVVKVFVDRLSTGQPVVLSDAGRYRSDLVFVGDVVQATITALQQPIRGVFNVGSGRATSVAELAEALVVLLSCDPGLVQPEPAGPDPAPGFAALDIQRALDAGLYVPTPLARGLAQTLAGARA